MSFTNVILSIIAIVVALPLVFLSLFALYLFVLGPLQHVWNTHRAEAANQTTWETGFADVYSIEVKIEVNNEYILPYWMWPVCLRWKPQLLLLRRGILLFGTCTRILGHLNFRFLYLKLTALYLKRTIFVQGLLIS